MDHRFALFLGGDHSVTIPLHRAFHEKVNEPFGVIHIDSHTDLMDSYEGHHWSHACTARRTLEDLNVAPQHYAFIGIRSWVSAELDYLVEHPDVPVYSARENLSAGH